MSCRHCCDDDSIDTMSDDEIIDVLRSRKGPGARLLKLVHEEYDEIEVAIKEGRNQDALAYLDRMKRPRWRDIHTCRMDYASARYVPPKRGLWYFL